MLLYVLSPDQTNSAEQTASTWSCVQLIFVGLTTRSVGFTRFASALINASSIFFLSGSDGKTFQFSIPTSFSCFEAFFSCKSHGCTINKSLIDIETNLFRASCMSFAPENWNYVKFLSNIDHIFEWLEYVSVVRDW